MARGTPVGVEDEGDFASTMAIAIGAVIALFTVAIAFFVMGPEPQQAAPSQRAAPRATSFPATLPVATTAAERQ